MVAHGSHIDSPAVHIPVGLKGTAHAVIANSIIGQGYIPCLFFKIVSGPFKGLIQAEADRLIRQQQHGHPLIGRIIQFKAGIQHVAADLQTHDPSAPAGLLAQHIVQALAGKKPGAAISFIFPELLHHPPLLIREFWAPVLGKGNGITALGTADGTADIPIGG